MGLGWVGRAWKGFEESGTIVSVKDPEGSGRRLQGAVCQTAPHRADRSVLKSLLQRQTFLNFQLLFVYQFLFISFFFLILFLKFSSSRGSLPLWLCGLQVSLTLHDSLAVHLVLACPTEVTPNSSQFHPQNTSEQVNCPTVILNLWATTPWTALYLQKYFHYDS